MIRFSFLLAYGILLSTCQLPAPGPFEAFLEEEGRNFSILIRGGQVIDGSGAPAFVADILLRNDSILFIGKVDTTLITVGQVIDAAGKTVSPGFIDTHAHGSPLATPGFENFLAMGVTSICLGQDGESPEYENLEQWMEKADSVGPAVNVAVFVGHGTLRRLSGTGYKPQPERNEQEKMEALLRAALDAGAFGMTTGLEYTPGIYAGDEELAALAKVVGKRNGLIMSHLRSEDDGALDASLQELLRQGQYCDVHVSHLKAVYGKGEQRAEEILALLDSARRNSLHAITADLYPYTASYTGIGIVFPQWAKPPHDYEKVKRERRTELLGFLRRKILARNGPEATLFGTPPYAGKTLANLSEEKEKPFEEVLLEMGPSGASGAYFVMDEALQSRLLTDAHVMICSDGSPTMHHPRGYGSFAKVIETYVQKEKRLSLNEAIRKMASLPAQTLGLHNRGLIRPAYSADLLVFDPERLRARADYSNPMQLAEGMDWVIVNGKVAFQEGELIARNGRVLRKGAPASNRR